ncbi:MAG: O-antigen ligase family protein [Candidatus Sabulitectum sp.]|nr:O-antigen ligase family protein [Candidatus Sabulitectum sp.]
MKTLRKLSTKAEFRLLIVWVSYKLFSYTFVAGSFDIVVYYELIGILFFYVLIVNHVSSFSPIDRDLLLLSILFAYALTMYGRLPAIFGLDSLPFLSEVLPRHKEAGYAGMFSLPLLFFLLERKNRVSINNLIWIWIFVCGTIVFLAAARTAIAGFIVIFMVYKRSIRRYIFLAVFSFVVFYYISTSEYASFSNDRILTLVNRNEEANEPNEIYFRAKNIEYGLESFREYPIFGVGYLNWQSVFSERANLIGFTRAAHNGYISILTELGLLGWILFASLIYVNLRGSKIHLTSNSDQNLLYTSSILVMGIFVYAFGGDAFNSRDIYYFLAIGMGAKFHFHAENQKRALLQATSDPDASLDPCPSGQNNHTLPYSDNQNSSHTQRDSRQHPSGNRRP